MAYEMILTALADPTRRQILEKIRVNSMPVRQIAQDLPVSRPAVSQHLKVLELSGLVDVRARGTARIYRARPGALAPLRAYLDDMWGDVLEAFADEVNNQMEQPDAKARHQND